MRDTTPQTAAGKVLWHFSMSLDGFVAGPGHGMGWMPEATNRQGLIEEYIRHDRGGPWWTRRMGCVPGCLRRLRRRVEWSGLRPHPSPGRRRAHRERHLPELRCRRGGGDRPCSRRRQERRSAFSHHRPPTSRTRPPRRNRSARPAGAARRWCAALRQPRRHSRATPIRQRRPRRGDQPPLPADPQLRDCTRDAPH